MRYYISSDSYRINDVLRHGYPLSERQKDTVNNLNSSFKLPNYKSDIPLYRSCFFDIEELFKYVSDKQVGKIFSEKGFYSTSKSVYDNNDSLRVIVTKYKNAKNLKGFNNNEKEVLFRNGTLFKISDAYINKNSLPILEVEEVDKK